MRDVVKVRARDAEHAEARRECVIHFSSTVFVRAMMFLGHELCRV